MYYDCHVHTVFSPDATSQVGDYCKWTDEGRLKAIGFAEHLDFLPECGAYGYLNYKEYIKEVEYYREKGYNFYAGAEVDYAKSVQDDIIRKLKEEPFDFTICSIHMVNSLSISDRKIDHFFNKNTFISILEGYYREIKYGLAVEEFNVIGHIGVYRRYLEKEFYSADISKMINEFEAEIAKLCAASNKIVEVNSSGLFATMASPVPDAAFLKRYYEAGGRRVCMSSDAHNAKHAGRGFDTIKDLLMHIGFLRIYLPWGQIAKLV